MEHNPNKRTKETAMMFVLDFLSPILAVISGIVLLQFGNS